MTTNTRYRIQKQILDIRQEQQGDAFARQTELRSRYENEVVPLLEKICDELCPAEQLIRIDTLDIALPPMTEQQYRTSWPTTVEKAFRETLSKAIAKAREPHHQNSTLLSQGEAELQLLTTFLHTGTVPWTYQQGQDRPLETLYKALLKQDPQGVRQMLVKGLRRKSFTERLCYQFPGLFPQLFDLLQPGHTKELSAYYQYLRHYVEHSTYTENNAKAVFLLHYHSLQQLVKQQDQGGKSFAKYTLRRISEAWKTPYNALLSELAKLTTPQRVPQHVQKALQELLLETASGYQETPAEDRFQREVQQLLRKTEQLIRTSETARAVQLETLKARLQQLIRHIETLPPETAHDYKKGIENIEQRLRTSETVSAAWFDALKPQLQQLIRYMETLPPETAYDYKKGIEDVKRWLGKTTPNEETVTALEATLHIALEAVSRLQENSSDTEKSVAIVRSVQNELKQWLHSTEQRPHASETVSAARFDALKARLHQLTQHLETLAPETAYDYKKGIEDIARQLAEIRPQVQDVNALHVQENTQKRWNRDKEETHIEGIYLQNAGMVILWSFFKPLFEALKFTENHKFIDEAQQHRAVHVLQYLAGEKEYCSEHELGLNKLLCGLELNTPIPKEVQLLEEEKERVNDLIQSAIGYWPAIKNTSVAGFREAFLLREGKLSRNGNDWQLQVVQKGYDVMMKTLPWGISLVKLPWMPGILYVEWPY